MTATTLQTYRDYKPTSYDSAGLSLPDRQDWLVAPVIQTRDSDCLEQSNFASLLGSIGGESDTVEVHSFNHWGPGWFEIILIDPADEKACQTAADRDSLAAFLKANRSSVPRDKRF